MKNNIILIGCMGCGKSSVGQRLAKTLGYQFLDTDNLIVKSQGKSISNIFETDGEGSFRQMETNLLIELNQSTSKSVIATGGGMPVKEENQELLRSLGHVFYLDTPLDILVKRVQGDTGRPLLAVGNQKEKIRKILEERSPKYISCAHTIINTNEKSFYELIKEIENALQGSI